jgi:ubiquinone/menaquinone biosynthesis C-methylase UbiE
METVREWFSVQDAAQKWDDMYASETEQLDEYNFRRRRDFTVSYVLSVVQPGACVLDLGCGAGPVISELRWHGVDCVGIDYAPDMLDYARTRLRSMSLDEANLLRGDCRHIPFLSASFDVIVCLGVISYVEERDRVLQEICRVLKPGGTLIISFRNKFNPILSDPISLAKTVVMTGLRRSACEEFAIGQYLDHRVMQARLEAQGFRSVQFTGIGFGPFRFCKWRLFSEKTSIKISRALTRFCTARRLHGVCRWMTDISLWVYQKPRVTKFHSDSQRSRECL